MNIVLVAGLWLDASVWEKTATALVALGHRPVPVDLPVTPGTTLADQVGAVLAAVDACERPLVVGHSAACGLAWLAADARPTALAGVALIGGFPPTGGFYADFFPVVDGVMAFPGWGPFEGADARDLGEAARAAFEAATVPVPEGVARGEVVLTDVRRYDVPVLMVCPEFTPAEAKAWVAAGDLPELAQVRHLSYADIETGHWPMLTAPGELARLLARA